MHFRLRAISDSIWAHFYYQLNFSTKQNTECQHLLLGEFPGTLGRYFFMSARLEGLDNEGFLRGLIQYLVYNN